MDCYGITCRHRLKTFIVVKYLIIAKDPSTVVKKYLEDFHYLTYYFNFVKSKMLHLRFEINNLIIQ